MYIIMHIYIINLVEIINQYHKSEDPISIFCQVNEVDEMYSQHESKVNIYSRCNCLTFNNLFVIQTRSLFLCLCIVCPCYFLMLDNAFTIVFLNFF